MHITECVNGCVCVCACIYINVNIYMVYEGGVVS